MHSVLSVLHVGGREVPIGSYGVLLCVAIGAIALGSLRAGKRAGLDLGACITALSATLAGSFCGALLLHALVQFTRSGSLTIALAQPGLAILGALFCGIATLLWVAPRLGLPALELADRAVPFVALGQALGRIGCLLGGCCYGRPWNGALALHYTDPAAPAYLSGVGRHPVPLYESGLLLGLFAVFWLRPPSAPGSGHRLLGFVASYSAVRLVLECLRGDEVRGLYFNGAVSTSQLLAMASLLVCAWLRVRATRGSSHLA